MISSLIIDDEENGRKNLANLIAQYCPELSLSGQAGTVVDAIRLIHQVRPQLLFLDIELTDGTGFDVLAKCKDIPLEVVFVTAYDQYGLHAIRFSAIDYILKPIDKGLFRKAVKKAKRQIELKTENSRLKNLLYNVGQSATNQRIALPFVDSIEFVETKKIIRLEADGSYTRIFMDNKQEYLVSGSLKEYNEMLGVHGFLRTHQAHLVNPAFIKSFVKTEGGFLKLLNGDSVPVSRLRKVEVIERLRRGAL